MSITPTNAAKLIIEGKANLSNGHKRNWVATGNIRKGENVLKKAGMMLCPICRGRGEIATKIEPVVKPCEWCNASGWDYKHDKVCFWCEGKKNLSSDRFRFDACTTCGGERVVSLRLDKSPVRV